MQANHRIGIVLAFAAALAAGSTARAVTDEQFNALKLKVTDLEAKAATSEEASARNNFLVTGAADVNYVKTEGDNGSFLMGSFNPIFLFRASDKVLFEAAMEFNVQNEDNGGSSVETVLEFAQIDWLVNDWLMLLAGKTVLPLGSFIETTDPAWINKLPTFPLPRADETAILPESDLGIQARGGIPVGDSGAYFNYAAFVVNGPGHTSDTDTNGVTTESLSFDSVENQNSTPGYGGKLGYFTPLGKSSSLELGVSGETGKWDSEGHYNWTALVGDARLHLGTYTELRGEVVQTRREGAEGSISPKGWWCQASHQLASLDLDSPILKKVELVVREGQVDLDQGDGSIKQLAVGINYHVSGTLVLKADYEFNTADTEDAGKDTLNLQVAYGF